MATRSGEQERISGAFQGEGDPGRSPKVAVGGPLTLALIVNIAAVIWGAATLSATVGQLTSSVMQLDVTVAKFGTMVQDLRERVRVLEDRDARGNRTQAVSPLTGHP